VRRLFDFRPELVSGDPAPLFTATGASGRRFSLADQFGRRRTLLIFYPEDLTSG
jgi:peroxiredoxin